MAEPPTSPTKGLSRPDFARRGLSQSETAGAPVTPPARYISSNYSTPGSAYGKEDDAIIIELSPRYMKAGIEGESYPQCRYEFKPANANRLGDYRQWLPGHIPAREDLKNWGEGHELWRNDLRDFDLGLLSDKLERAVREVYNKHLLVDAGNARLVLVVPSLVPHPVLETILQTLFERWSYPSITLLPTPAMTLVAAGLRSGLVVDIGWEETVVTAVYEYREVTAQRSTRAMKRITEELVRWAREKVLREEHRVDLNTVEMFLSKAGLDALLPSVLDETDELDEELSQERVEVDWPTDTFTKPASFVRRDLQTNLRETLLGASEYTHPDNEEIPLHNLIYNTLLWLPADIRGVCISRITFIGEGTEVIRCASTIVDAFVALLNERGWTDVQNPRAPKKRQGLTEIAQAPAKPADIRHDDLVWSEKDLTEERYLREKAKHTQPSVQGVVRRINSLGPWAGASLLATLKIKSFVEVQRDKFMSHGLAGASKDNNVSVVPQQRNSMMGLRPKAGERTSWTLSGWG